MGNYVQASQTTINQRISIIGGIYDVDYDVICKLNLVQNI